MARVAVLLASHGTNELCNLLEHEDQSMQAIADLWGCTKRQVQLWIEGDPERAARARKAREGAAAKCDREADNLMRAIIPESTAAELARAKFLAQSYRWRARVRTPRRRVTKAR